jgi:hypothetical protein
MIQNFLIMGCLVLLITNLNLIKKNFKAKNNDNRKSSSMVHYKEKNFAEKLKKGKILIKQHRKSNYQKN